MRTTDQYEKHNEGAPDEKLKMVCAVWVMTPRRHVFIGAANMDALVDVWKEIVGSDLDRMRVQYVLIGSQNTSDSRKPGERDGQ